LEHECPQLAAGVLKELMTMPDDLRSRMGTPTTSTESSQAKRPRL
jgi:hypothetical protein